MWDPLKANEELRGILVIERIHFLKGLVDLKEMCRFYENRCISQAN